MLKKVLYILLFLLTDAFVSPLNAQGLYLEGGVQMVLQGDVRLAIDSAGMHNNGIFTPGNSTVYFGGANAVAVSGTAETFFNNVIFRGSGTKWNAGNASVIRTIGVEGSTTFDADGAANTRVFTLRSSDTVTANVDILTGGDISGNVTVERFINTGVGAGEHLKSWQFLATPTTGQTIYQSWQENGSTPVGYGTIITGTGIGFDITTLLPSMKSFEPSTSSWVGVNNTNNPIVNSNGYMLFVRGDRSVVTHNGAPNNTNMRTRGVLFKPNNPPPSITVLPNQYQTFGNPYASRIAFNNVYVNSTGILDVFYVWDPTLNGSYNLGGYQTISGITGYIPSAGNPSSFYPAGVPSPYIESGQAVFVRGNAIGGNVQFNEGCKMPDSRLVHRSVPQQGQTRRSMLFTTLVTASGSVADGNIVVFGSRLGNEVNEFDALKLKNDGENISLLRNATLLAVEARENIRATDTLHYFMERLRTQAYQLMLSPNNFPTGLQAFFIDRYLRTSTPISLSDTTFVHFTIENNPQSKLPNRFYILFKRGAQPNLNIFAETQSTSDAHLISLTNDAEKSIDHYVFQMKKDKQSFEDIQYVKPENNNGIISNYALSNSVLESGTFTYRVKAICIDGESYFSNEVVLQKSNNETLTIFPNPVSDGLINISLKEIPIGNTEWKLIHSNGNIVAKGTRLVQQKHDNFSIKLPPLQSGVYQLAILLQDGTQRSTTVVVL